MELRHVSRLATDFTLSTVMLPLEPAARAAGLERTVARLDADARDAVGRFTSDPRLRADARALRCRAGLSQRPSSAPPSPPSRRARPGGA